MAVVLAALPFLYLIWLCSRTYVDVPFWDQWELVPRLDKLDQGTFTIADLWAQHNEHRPLFPVSVMLILARLSGWNIGLEIATGVILGAGIFCVHLRYFAVSWKPYGGTPVWLLPVISLLVFSPAQWENWTWGWQMPVTMGLLSSVGGLLLVCSDRSHGGRDAAAIACGIAATYSFAAGLVYWVVGAVAIALVPGQRRLARLGVWVAAAVVTFATYFYHYEVPPGGPSVGKLLGSVDLIRTMTVYVLKYLGAPLAAGHESLAAALGVAGVIVFALLVARGWRLWPNSAFMFPAAIGAQSIIVAGISALGRAGLGTAQALSSRYTTMSTPLWVAVLMLLALILRAGLAPLRRDAGHALMAAALVIVTALDAATGAVGVVQAEARSAYLRPARRALISGRNPEMLARLHPDPAIVRQRRAILRMLHMSVFRD